MSWRGAMTAATVATLGRSDWWLIALAAFLVRGGVLLLVVPLLVLPTPAELASLVSPSLVGTGLAHPTGTLVSLIGVLAAALFVAILLTTAVGTWLDVALVEAVAADQEIGPVEAMDERRSGEGGHLSLWSSIEVRLAAHVPTAVAVGVGLIVLGNALQAELLSPPTASPLAVRVLLREPIASAAIVLAWAVGEAWGGLAMRRLATTRATWSALGLGLRDLVRPSGLATLAVTSLVVAAAVAALWLAAGRAFDRLWPLVVEPSDAALLVLGLGLLVGTWGVGLWLVGIALAWRSAAWTTETGRTKTVTQTPRPPSLASR
jgi:hypothetical protein